MRVVWSAWDGKLDHEAGDFLEHHDHGQHAEPKGEGAVCPVTASVTEEGLRCVSLYYDALMILGLKVRIMLCLKMMKERLLELALQGMLREVKRRNLSNA